MKIMKIKLIKLIELRELRKLRELSDGLRAICVRLCERRELGASPEPEVCSLESSSVEILTQEVLTTFIKIYNKSFTQLNVKSLIKVLLIIFQSLHIT